MKLWQKGYDLNREIEAFITGDDYLLDMQLLEYDCKASQAHARMLGKTGFISENEVVALVKELNTLIDLVREGKFKIRPDQEDCHTAIEEYLTERLGEPGKKIHTGRSRNDQVLTALRLFVKAQLKRVLALTQNVVIAIEAFVEKYGRIAIPGFTHTRKAMPSSVGMWAEAYRDALEDDLSLLRCAIDLIDQSPLGTGAGYGVPLPLDREYTAQELGFARVQANPVYAQHSRSKFDSFAVHVLSQIMFDLNRMANDLIFFSLPEFDFFRLPDEFLSGSSIMPQKKNPDVLELLRARFHEVSGCEATIRNCSVGLISGYNRDVQVTKEPLMKAFNISLQALAVTELLFGHLAINEDRCQLAMTEELFAADQAYELVRQGVPFRDAYQQVAQRFMKSGS
ncbi:MAG: argininosuccinate lyase [Candidatus Rifleibacteriota bacterium]